ncbi:uncharacterized protein LOC130749185 [Lotus japonicus]|uniref:uncharacterized protein LOC130749185 n=1 Tax=Lotus japonicus TaxID=34305 RepID=UPI00258F64B5|nr:uncharacterized protein LOC130749185 [Lotus japonicus]
MKPRRQGRSEEMEQKHESSPHCKRIGRLRREKARRAQASDVRLQNDCLQEELKYYRLRQWNEEAKKAEAAAKVEPFSIAVREVTLPDGMRNLALETYDGRIDPKDHLFQFNEKMAVNTASDAVKCKMLPFTFRGAAMAWFMTLPQGSIAKFRDLSSKFLVQFSAGTIEDLFDIRQRERETLKQYMERYNAASTKFEELEYRTCVCVFKSGLMVGKLSCELSRKPARSMTEVRARARDYILEEEDDAYKRKRVRAAKVSLARKRIQDKEASNVRKVKEVGQFIKKFKGKLLCSGKESIKCKLPRQTTNSRRRRRPGWHSSEELAKSLQEATFAKTGEDGKCRIDPWHEVKGWSQWCEYHNLEGHNTSDCLSLKGQVRQLIRARQPRVTGHGLDRDQRDSRRRAPIASKGKMNTVRGKEAEEAVNDKGGASDETANIIAGGFDEGDSTSTARRKQVRVVASAQEYPAPFGCQHPDIVISLADFEGIKAHTDDPLVVMVRINGFNVQRVLLDQGSSVDIIYGAHLDSWVNRQGFDAIYRKPGRFFGKASSGARLCGFGHNLWSGRGR